MEKFDTVSLNKMRDYLGNRTGTVFMDGTLGIVQMLILFTSGICTSGQSLEARVYKEFLLATKTVQLKNKQNIRTDESENIKSNGQKN